MQGKVKFVRDQKNRSESSHLVEVNKSQRLLEMIKKAERESPIGHTLDQAKESIWMEIINSMNDIWSCIQIIF